MRMTEILLLTNRDSDNVGDQIIEASVISLLRAACENLGLESSNVKIRSRAASLISRKYMDTGDESLIEPARRAIARADVIVFGGAPLFNYVYQRFYLRTIRTVELAAEYDVPVIFSSIGVEPFSATDSRSVALQQALQLPVVRQITTRDDLESTEKYAANTQISTALVSDPAVFADSVFEKVSPAAKAGTGRCIGLVVTRVGIFPDNDIDFSEKDQRDFWLGVIDELKGRGDDFRLFTTGHFDDEIFLDSLVRHHGVPSKNAAVTVNSPEELIEQLRACDGVIAYRLHASITSFAFDIPSIGLSWNFKVPEFYRSMGYAERALPPADWSADTVIRALDKAMEEGVVKDDDILMSVYRTLFSGLKDIFSPGTHAQAYSIGDLRNGLPRYSGTTRKQYQDKMRRKLRRSYGFYQEQKNKTVAKVPSDTKSRPRMKRFRDRIKTLLNR